MPTSIRVATPADLGALTSVLTDAFDDDPLMVWVFPGAERRRRLAGMFGYLAEHRYVPGGASTMVDGDDACALWLAPQPDEPDTWWSRHLEGFATALEGDLERLGALGPALTEIHPHEPHWYLLAIGVRSVAQGRGLGSALLAHTLAIADEQGMPAYLEASSPRSRMLYDRFGFEVLAELRAGDGPPVWPMWRAPASAAPPAGP
jgi:GNAT superfamily N-acetyltransferase